MSKIKDVNELEKLNLRKIEAELSVIKSQLIALQYMNEEDKTNAINFIISKINNTFTMVDEEIKKQDKLQQLAFVLANLI